MSIRVSSLVLFLILGCKQHPKHEVAPTDRVLLSGEHVKVTHPRCHDLPGDMAIDQSSPHSIALDVSIMPFRIDRDTVSCKQWDECVSAKRCSALITEGECDNDKVDASYAGAAAYCAWRGGRLASLAEWQRAIRGREGRTMPDGGPVSNVHLECTRRPCAFTTPEGIEYRFGVSGEWVEKTLCATNATSTPNEIFIISIMGRRLDTFFLMRTPSIKAKVRCAFAPE